MQGSRIQGFGTRVSGLVIEVGVELRHCRLRNPHSKLLKPGGGGGVIV